jgi:hypothetical protein
MLFCTTLPGVSWSTADLTPSLHKVSLQALWGRGCKLSELFRSLPSP